MSNRKVNFTKLAKEAAEPSSKALALQASIEAMEAVHGFDSLTQRQQRLLVAWWRTGDIDVAWKEAGIESRAEADLILGSEKVVRVLKRHRKNRLLSVDADKARQTMVDLLAPTVAASTRFQAAKWILEEAGHNAKASDPGEKPLGEMTPSELLAFVNQQRGIVEQADTKDVTIDVLPAE